MGFLSVSQIFMGFLRVIRVNLIPGIVGLNGIQSCNLLDISILPQLQKSFDSSIQVLDSLYVSLHNSALLSIIYEYIAFENFIQKNMISLIFQFEL